MNIVKLISDKVEDFHKSGKIEEIVEKYTLSCLEEIIKDSFKWNGEAKKSLEEALAGKLSVNLERIKLDRYQSIVSRVVEEEINGTLIKDLRTDIQDVVKELTGFMEQKEYKLSEIVEKYIDSIDKSYDGDMESKHGDLTLIVEDDGKFAHVYIDKESDKRKYECEIQFHLHKSKLYHAKVDQVEFSPFMIDNLHEFEAFLFKLYCNNVSVVLDEQDCETSYYREDYD